MRCLGSKGLAAEGRDQTSEERTGRQQHESPGQQDRGTWRSKHHGSYYQLNTTALGAISSNLYIKLIS